LRKICGGDHDSITRNSSLEPGITGAYRMRLPRLDPDTKKYIAGLIDFGFGIFMLVVYGIIIFWVVAQVGTGSVWAIIGLIFLFLVFVLLLMIFYEFHRMIRYLLKIK
jgi:hypothetical protein